MEHRITETELTYMLDDVLARIRCGRESFLVDRDGEAVARIIPVTDDSTMLLGEALQAWTDAAPPDERFADDLERVAANDRPPELQRTS